LRKHESLTAQNLNVYALVASEPHRLGPFRARSILRAILPIGLIIFATLLAASTTSDRKLEPDGAPDRQADGPGVPPPIVWPAPPLGKGPFFIESAEERNLRVTVVARGLEQPWSIAFLPDGRMLVTERPGRLRVIRDGVINPTPVEGVPEVHADGLQGLMDVALHPNFDQNRWVYLTYHKAIGHEGAVTLARGVWNGVALVDVHDIFESEAIQTEASRITFGRDGMLYMTVSAPGGTPDGMRAQDPSDYAGKVVRLRDDGTVPPDNPFVHRAGYKPAIFTLGHRNGHSVVVNPETGDLWATEQGPSGGDEINILKPGRNYGWPLASYGRQYFGPLISSNPLKKGTEPPTLFWMPSIGVTGMTFYTGDKFPNWKRNAFVGGLREGEVPRTGQLQRVVFNENWQEIRRESLLRELHQRIRDVRQGPDGFLYVLTAEKEGALLRIEPATH
jgi:aldose sugar dehydrogenase